MKKSKNLLLSLFLICTLILQGCGTEKVNEVKSEEKSKETKTTVLKLEGGDWGNLTPYSHYSRGPGAYKMRLIFDSLLERGDKGLIPWIAEKWEVSPDGKEYTFMLKNNVKWHDGKELTAEDVKFSLEYFAKHSPVSDSLNVKGKSFVKKAEVLDKNKIKITMEKPNATTLDRMADIRIIPKHIWEKVEDPKKFNKPEALIGCGPYKLDQYIKEQGAYKFSAFKDYWGPKPKVDVLQFIPVSDAVLAFDKGEIDITNITPDILPKYENNKKFVVKQNPAFWGYRLIFNMEKKPEFKTKELRQAICYAIDKQELIEKVARGAAKAASAGYLPEDHLWYNNDVKHYDFNLDKAKKLLNNKKHNFTLLVSNSKPELRIAELIKINLEKVGINLIVKSVDMKTRDASVKSKDYEMVLNGHGGWGNDADILRTIYSSDKKAKNSSSLPGYNNEKINELSQKQLVEMNEANRKDIIFQMQKEIAEEVPQIPIYNTTEYTVYKPEKYDGWRYMFNHHELTHNKLSYLEVK
ncbi:MAG: ABC transporter substrate-binding protein [Clostridium sp.]|uniref:ABC transporter substrate-binding protein n=1 Tax=Clostridium sp. TaxID=1506 RepID=UPI003D6C9509